MSDATVKYFTSAMSGAPATLSTTHGTILAVLDGCLVDGFGEVTLDSLVVSSNVATATVSAGHNFAMIGATGPVILIAGATPSGLNGEWRVTVTSSTQFTFATSGITDQTATGTITAKRAPAGWESYSPGSNLIKRYWTLDQSRSRLMLYVADNEVNNSQYSAALSLQEGQALDGTVSTLASGLFMFRSESYANWTLIADQRAVYLAGYNDSNTPWSALFFGELTERYDVDDQYAWGLAGNTDKTSSPAGTTGNYSLISGYRHLSAPASTLYGARIAKSKAGSAGVSLMRVAHAMNNTDATSSAIGIGGGTAVVGSQEIVYPVEGWDQTTPPVYRGKMPGWMTSLHGPTSITSPLEHGGLERTLAPVPMRYFTSVAWQLLDITGPWR
jgi:hypothetical protein